MKGIEKTYTIIPTSGSYQRCAYFLHGVFSRMYLPLALKVYRLFIDSLDFIVTDNYYTKKHLLWLTQSKNSLWPSVPTLPSWFGEN